MNQNPIIDELEASRDGLQSSFRQNQMPTIDELEAAKDGLLRGLRDIVLRKPPQRPSRPALASYETETQRFESNINNRRINNDELVRWRDQIIQDSVNNREYKEMKEAEIVNYYFSLVDEIDELIKVKKEEKKNKLQISGHTPRDENKRTSSKRQRTARGKKKPKKRKTKRKGKR